MSKQRVLHVLHTSLPVLAGYCLRSAYILKHQGRGDVEQRVVTSAQHPNGELMQETIEGVLHYRTPVPAKQLPSPIREWQLISALQKRIEEVVDEWRPDVIHAHSPVLVGLPAQRVAKARGIRFVYEIRDFWENALVDRGRFSANSLFYKSARGLESRVARQADHVVVICEQLKRALTDRLGDDLAISIVDNGVDLETFKDLPDASNLKSEMGLNGKYIVGYIGTFQPYEGLDTLIKAVHVLSQKQPDVHLVIVGGGGVEESLHKLVKELKMEACVSFTGRVPHEEVARYYSLIDAFAYPRLNTQTTALTTPLKPLEAMACHKPVIVSDLPAMLELVTPNKTGLVSTSDDPESLAAQINSLRSDPSLSASIVDNAWDWLLSNRQWHLLAERYKSIYESDRTG